ncbi:MAG: hypothetical protein H7263_14770, partial [Candidatus Sericytochromatia bacterium]|nr:hypothetical protein [Candidatus Sericytochromatia bacterium]
MKKIFFYLKVSLIVSILNAYPTQAKALDAKILTKNNTLEIIFGKNNIKKSIFAHQLSQADNRKFDIGDVGKDIFTDIVAIKEFKQNGVKQCLVITETKNDLFSCHVCAPIVGIALLAKHNNKWIIKDNHQYVGKIGTFGNAPNPKLIKVGRDNYGLFFESFYTGMGMASSQVYIIAKTNKDYKIVLTDFDFSQDNKGSCGEDIKVECYKYLSKVDYLKNAKSVTNFLPINITTSGKRYNKKDLLEKFSLTKKYV